MIYNRFLSNTLKNEFQLYTASYQRKGHRRGVWKVNLGGIHGLQPGNQGDAQLMLQLPNGQCPAYATKVGTNEAEIKLEPYAYVSIRKTYPVLVSGLMASQMKVYITGDSEPEETLKSAYIAQKEELAAARIELVEDEKAANFVIRAFDGQYILTYPNRPFQPLIEQINHYSEANSSIMMSRLKRVSRWQFVRTLYNDYNHLQPEQPIKVEFVQQVNGQEVILNC